jgi:hypothetical protein
VGGLGATGVRFGGLDRAETRPAIAVVGVHLQARFPPKGPISWVFFNLSSLLLCGTTGVRRGAAIPMGAVVPHGRGRRDGPPRPSSRGVVAGSFIGSLPTWITAAALRSTSPVVPSPHRTRARPPCSSIVLLFQQRQGSCAGDELASVSLVDEEQRPRTEARVEVEQELQHKEEVCGDGGLVGVVGAADAVRVDEVGAELEEVADKAGAAGPALERRPG